MKKCRKYPNRNIWVDPRSILSERMPEGTLMFQGIIGYGFPFLHKSHYCTYKDIENEKEIVYNLTPFNISNNKQISSHVFINAEYVIEFFRTSRTNYKIYILKWNYQSDRY